MARPSCLGAGSLGCERLAVSLGPRRTSRLPSYPAARLRRSSFNGITLSATKGHTLFLNAPWTEHVCRSVCFTCNSPLLKRPYENRQSKGCIFKMRRVYEQRLAVRVATEKGYGRRSRRVAHWRGASPRRQAGAGRFGADAPRASRRARQRRRSPPFLPQPFANQPHHQAAGDDRYGDRKSPFWKNTRFSRARMARACAPQVGGGEGY